MGHRRRIIKSYLPDLFKHTSYRDKGKNRHLTITVASPNLKIKKRDAKKLKKLTERPGAKKIKKTARTQKGSAAGRAISAKKSKKSRANSNPLNSRASDRSEKNKKKQGEAKPIVQQGERSARKKVKKTGRSQTHCAVRRKNV